jgi:hypothetical protein
MACLIMKLGIDVKAKDLNFNFKYFIESKEHDSDDITMSLTLIHFFK